MSTKFDAIVKLLQAREERQLKELEKTRSELSSAIACQEAASKQQIDAFKESAKPR